MSAVIRRHHYNPDLKELSLWFGPDLCRYKYFGVPQPIYEALVNSQSMGRFFNEAIKDHYPCRLIDPSHLRTQRWQALRSVS